MKKTRIECRCEQEEHDTNCLYHPKWASTESKHTPGPWQVDCRRIQRLESKGDQEFVYIIAECTQLDTDANARLIAAAPDLLEACKSILDMCEPGIHQEAKKRGGVHKHFHELNLCAAARKAIAKAEGK